MEYDLGDEYDPEELPKPFDYELALSLICATYPAYDLDRARALDGQDFFTLYDNIDRVNAARVLQMMEAVAAGMSGGDYAKATIAKYQQILDRSIPLREKQEHKYERVRHWKTM